MSTQNAPAFDLSTLLSGSLDDLADRPEFRPFVQGVHSVKLKLEKDEKHATVYFAKGTLVETLEQKDPAETPMEPGAKFSTRMDVSNQFGQGDLKMLLAAASELTGSKSVPDLLRTLEEGIDCIVVTENRTNKDKTYTSIVACKAA